MGQKVEIIFGGAVFTQGNLLDSGAGRPRDARQAAVAGRHLPEWRVRARTPVEKMDAYGRVDRVAEPPVAYFTGEKSVGSMNTDSTLLTILPLASESF
jgi:hypothetical protein